MTSTGFTVGLGEGTRISSKVLKPPGGGSSDIFGMENNKHAVAQNFNETVNNKEPPTISQAGYTQDRLFGSTGSPVRTKSTRGQSNIFGDLNQQTTRSPQKKYVRRNPITGEVLEIVVKSDKEDVPSEKEDDEKEASETNAPVQTSIRVRNPPGGKSSGIF